MMSQKILDHMKKRNDSSNSENDILLDTSVFQANSAHH